MNLPRTLSLAALAVIGTLSSFAATTAPAGAANGPYYRAELATPVASARTDIQKGVLWNCEGNVCVAPAKGHSRAMIVCQRLAGEFGAVTSFAAGNETYGAAELAKCND